MAKAQFDRTEVIEKLVALFWENGFSATSMQQVTKATGLKPGSLYLAFGNKESLYREALQKYTEISFASIAKTLNDAPSIKEGFCAILEKKIQEATKKTYCSCFLIKTQLELATEGNELHDFAASKLDEIEKLYQSYLEKEFSPALSSRRAVSIMLHIYGLRVYGYQKHSVDRARLGLQEGLPWLPWEKFYKS